MKLDKAAPAQLYSHYNPIRKPFYNPEYVCEADGFVGNQVVIKKSETNIASEGFGFR